MSDCEGEHASGDTNALPPAGEDGPLQLIEFVAASKDSEIKTITLNNETLDLVFQEIGDRPISVICVCGPSREGKSFLLGYIIRCLQGLEKGEEDDWMDWGDPKKPLQGFKFKTGVEPETKGIWVWSRPFIVKGDEGTEIAVLLLDTQGTYDESTSTKDMSAIVGLSLLASSVMIFNFFNNLKENILSDLNTYIQYGSLALDNAGESASPFQKLNFLIRDWNIPSQFPFGGKGGKLFLKDKLKVKDGQPKEAKHVREMIGKCFQELDCFLMPGIGDAALELNFTGSIDELAPKFAKALEEFINSLLVDEILPIKEILGSPVSASHFKSCLEAYIKIFNSDEVPSSEVMWQATSQMSNNNVIEKAEKQYRDVMKKKLRGRGYFQEEGLNSAHSIARKTSLALFSKSKIFGEAETISQFRTKLETLIEEEFQNFRNQNKAKRQKFVTNATADAANSFRFEIEGQFPFAAEDNLKFYNDMKLKQTSVEVRSTILQEFEQKFPNEQEDKLTALSNTLQEIFDTIFNSHMNQNRVNRANSEHFMSKIVEDLMACHRTKFQNYLDSNKFEEDKTVIQNNHNLLKAEMIELYHQKKISDNEEFHQQFLTRVEGSLETAFTEMVKDHMYHVQQILQKTETSLTALCDQFESDLRIIEQEDIFEDQLEELGEEKMSFTLEKFRVEVNPFPPASPRKDELEVKAAKQLQNVSDKLKTEVDRKRRQSLDSWQSAKKYALKYYQREMKTITESADFIDGEDLQEEHYRILDEAIKRYEDFEKIDVPPKALEIKYDLKQDIAQAWGQIKEQNQTRMKLTINEAKNCLRDCMDGYTKTMAGLKHQQQTCEQFRTSHLNAKSAALLQVREKCPLRDPTTLEEYENDLETRIDDMFKELSVKREEEENLVIREILPGARKHYHDEMKKRCENEPFINPELLVKIHELITESVLRKLKSGTKRFRQEDVKSNLDSLLGIYMMQNDMKLNSEGKGAIPAIGIDLGTTNCCVAVYYKDKVHIIPNQQQGGSETTPSYVAFNPDGSETIGEPAKRNAHKDVMPERTIYDAKRIIGRKMEDPELQNDMKFWPFTVQEDDGVPKIVCNYRPLYPEQIAGKLLAYCKTMAESFLKLKPGMIKKAVITVPAYFNDGQRQATVDAGKLANLEVLTIMNEPTAAAIAYSLKRLDTDPRKILIYDLGGGTFDVAVLDVQPKEIKVLGVKGDTHLGGEDFDKKMMEHCVSCFQRDHGIDLFFGKDSDIKPRKDEARRRLRRLQTECEWAKKTLATADSAQVLVEAILDGRDLNVTITRKEFENMNMVHFEKTIRLIAEALEEVGVRKQDIDDVVLVGGSSRIPKVQEMLQTFFEGKTLNKSIHPDLAVAYGAAVQAALMNGEQTKGHLDLDQIQDVTPMSLGVEIVTRELSVILPKNTRIPARRKEVYRTVFDNQTSISVNVYQGEDLKRAANNKLLGIFSLNGIPPRPKGAEPLDIWMEINAMGILHVEAICRSTQGKNSITVEENKKRMRKETINKLLKEEEARKMVPFTATGKAKKSSEPPQNDILQMIMESTQFEIEMLRSQVLAFQGPHVTSNYKTLLSACEKIKSDLNELDVTGSDKKGVKMDGLRRIDELRRALTGKVHGSRFCPQCVK